METFCTFAITGTFNGIPCVGTVTPSRQGFVANCFCTDNNFEELGNPAFFSSFNDAVEAVKRALK